MTILPNGQPSTQEPLEAQTHVWNQMFSLINSMSLKCAVQLCIPDIIHKHGKPMTLSELTDALQINKAKSQCVYRLMRLLTHSGFFIKVNNISEVDQEHEAYCLTPASSLLRDEPLNVTPMQFMLDPIFVEPWNYVSEWLCNDGHKTAFEMAHGRTFWEHMGHVPRLNRLFNESMASDSELANRVVLGHGRGVFEGFESFVDVGGGTGTMAKAVADAFPEMRCMVLDLPHVVDGLEGSENLSFTGGDMFGDIPHADVVLLKCLLHDWNDEDGVKILKKCKEAIGRSKVEGRKVIVIDMILGLQSGGDKAMEDQLLYDMGMMVYLNGKERTEKEWAKLFSDAGFSGYKVTLELGIRSLIEVYP